jgi:hypothetical protein
MKRGLKIGALPGGVYHQESPVSISPMKRGLAREGGARGAFRRSRPFLGQECADACLLKK